MAEKEMAFEKNFQEKKNIKCKEKTEHSGNDMSENKLPEPGTVLKGRRDFLGKILIVFFVVIGMEFGYSVIRLLTTKPTGEKKTVLISLTSLPIDGKIEVVYGGNKIEIKRTEKGITAMSMVCTHLGCLVIWEEEKRQYHCPCHDAYFSEDGQVISGPTTIPLEKISVTVRGNTVIIGG